MEIKHYTNFLAIRHFEELEEIEKQSRLCKKWILKDFLTNFNLRNIFSRVIMNDNRIIGYMIVSVYIDTVHIHRLAIHKDFFNERLDKTLFVILIDNVRSRGYRIITTEIEEPYLYVYERAGFRKLSSKRAIKEYLKGQERVSEYNEYTKPTTDKIIMELKK